MPTTVPIFFEVLVAAQGADEVLDGVAHLEGREHGCGLAEDLEDEGDGAVDVVLIGDGERGAFAGLVHAEDDELSGVDLAGYGRRLHGDGRSCPALVSSRRSMMVCIVRKPLRRPGPAEPDESFSLGGSLCVVAYSGYVASGRE